MGSLDETISFETDHLLSKWGFADGLLLEDFLRQNGFGPTDHDFEPWHEFVQRVLCEVVECCVLPEIENDIKPYRVSSSHNPIRIYEVDGRHNTELEPGFLLNPHSVEVPSSTVLRFAAQVYESRFLGSGEPVSVLHRSPEATAIFEKHSWL